MAGLMNTVSRLAGTAGSVSKRRGTGTAGAGGMGRRGGMATGGGKAGMASGLLSRFMKRR